MKNKFHINKHLIQRRLKVLQIDAHLTKPFINMVFRWLDQSGPEWTAKRLKSLKNDFIQLHANSATIQTPWVKVNKSHTRFRGILGLIQDYSFTSDKNFNKVLNLMNVYTAFQSDTLLPSQEEKFISAVTDKGVEVPEKYHQMLSNNFETLKTIDSQSKVSGPLLLSGYRKPAHMKRTINEVRYSFRQSVFQNLLIEFHELLYPSLVDLLGFRGYYTDQPFPNLGEIGITQEPGLKARFYAAPMIWIQHVLRPLGSEMYSYIKSHTPWDCTFDQDKAIPDIQVHLKAHKKVYCYDLSSATDRFPLELQVTMMNSLFTNNSWHKHIELFKELCKIPFNFQGKPLKWERGQPLGMFPSFAMFTLTHGMLLYALNEYKWNNQFYVLGDDVIILDDKLAENYENALKDLDIPYSPEKTLNSFEFGEFTGRIVLPDTVFPMLKWKTVNPNNYLDTVKNWGLPSLSLLPRKVQSAVKAISALPEPWGKGYNPEGLSLSERFQRVDGLLDQEITSGYLASFRVLVSTYFKYTDFKSTHPDFYRNLKLADDADQAYQKVLRENIPSLRNHPEGSGLNLMLVQQQLNLKMDSPDKGGRPHQSLIDSPGLLGKLLEIWKD